MTVLIGKALTNFVSKRDRLLRQRHGAEHTAQTFERVVRHDSASLEEILAAFTGDDDGVAAVRSLANLAEVALKIRHCDSH